MNHWPLLQLDFALKHVRFFKVPQNDHGVHYLEALAEFYKIPRPAAEDEAPIDAPGFDADDHVRRLLRERNLEELLETDDHLCHEIKTLDSDMQMLVYEVRAARS